MSRTCTICKHSMRTLIETQIINQRPYRDIAGQFMTTKSSVGRHLEHMKSIIQAVEEERHAEVRSMFANLEDMCAANFMQADALRLTATNGIVRVNQTTGVSYQTPDLRTALMAIMVKTKQMELYAKLTGQFRKEPENQEDFRRQKGRYERGVQLYMDRMAAAGQPVTRDAAIRTLTALEPEMSRYVS